MKPLSKFLVTLFVAIVIVYVVALWFGLFNTVWWLDIVMHIAGGVWVGGLFFVIFTGVVRHEAYTHPVEYLKVLVLVIAFAVFVGVLWEFFEFILTHITGVPLQGNVADTMKDLLMDIVGGAGAGMVLLRFMRRS